MPIGCGLVAKSGGWGPHSHLGRVGGTGGVLGSYTGLGASCRGIIHLRLRIKVESFG